MGRGDFKHTSKSHLRFATASLESGSANIDDSPLQEALLGMPMSGFSTGTVEKAPCTDLRSDPTLLPKFLQNYAGGRVRQPRTPNTSAARKSLN